MLSSITGAVAAEAATMAVAEQKTFIVALV
jgi:hypothetical protein